MSSFFDFIGTLIQLFVFVIVIVGIIAFFGYNNLRALLENVKEAFSNIGVTSRKQVSLTNQLIETVKGYADNEKFVHLKVSSDMTASILSETSQQSGRVVTAVSGLAQRFPDLKANEQYNMLMQAINNIENDLEAQRERYNFAAKAYNVKRTAIPHIFYSGTLGFKPAPYLDLASAEPQDMGILRTINTDDGERLNQLLGAAGSKTASVLRSVSTAAIEHGKVAVNAAQTRVKHMQQEQFTYLDTDRNPQGPIDLDALKALYADGKIADPTPVMPVGANAWLTFADVLAYQKGLSSEV